MPQYVRTLFVKGTNLAHFAVNNIIYSFGIHRQTTAKQEKRIVLSFHFFISQLFILANHLTDIASQRYYPLLVSFPDYFYLLRCEVKILIGK